MEKQRKFNLGKLIVLLSCLAVFAVMVTSIAVTKPIKANSAAEMETAIVESNNNSAEVVRVLINNFILTNDRPSYSGSYYFAEGKDMTVSYIQNNKILNIGFASVSLGGTINLMDEVKKGSLKYDCYYSVIANMGSIYSISTSFIISSLPLPPDPIKEGHTFVGWYLDSELTRPYDHSPILADTQLYAKFTANQYWVTFDSNGGNSFNSSPHAFGTLPIVPDGMREGYDFKGWFIGDTKYVLSPMTGDLALRAEWEIKHFDLTYNVSGGSAVTNATIDWNTTPTLETTSKEGYTFLGWFIGETEYTARPMIDNISLTAKWEINRYTVAYDSNGGTDFDSVTQDWNTTITLPTPTQEGYTFLGWFNGSTKYTVAPLTANLNLTAEWEIIQYTVTFYVDGKVYTTLKIDHGKGLGAAMAEQGLLFFNVVDELGNKLGKATTITSERTFNIAEMTQNEKVGAFIAENDWILWAVGISLVVLIGAVIILIKKIKG